MHRFRSVIRKKSHRRKSWNPVVHARKQERLEISGRLHQKAYVGRFSQRKCMLALANVQISGHVICTYDFFHSVVIHGGSRGQPLHEVWRSYGYPFLNYEFDISHRIRLTGEGRSLAGKISGGRGRRPANILVPLDILADRQMCSSQYFGTAPMGEVVTHYCTKNELLPSRK